MGTGGAAGGSRSDGHALVGVLAPVFDTSANTANSREIELMLILTQIWVNISSIFSGSSSEIASIISRLLILLMTIAISRVLAVLADVSNIGANTPTSAARAAVRTARDGAAVVRRAARA